MINITINNEQFKVCESWQDVTIRQAANVFRLCDSMPDKLKRLYQALIDKEGVDEIVDTFTDEDRIKAHPEFYGRVMCELSDVDSITVNKILWHDRTAFYHQYIEKFIIGLLHHPFDFQQTEESYFRFKGRKYMYPQDKVVINDRRPMGEADTIEFAESADLELASRKMSGGKYEVAANIVSILCRPEGEAYNEQTSLKRAEQFHDLPMTVFWQVFFCLQKRLNNLVADSLIYSLGQGLKRRLKRRSRVLNRSGGMVQ